MDDYQLEIDEQNIHSLVPVMLSATDATRLENWEVFQRVAGSNRAEWDGFICEKVAELSAQRAVIGNVVRFGKDREIYAIILYGERNTFLGYIPLERQLTPFGLRVPMQCSDDPITYKTLADRLTWYASPRFVATLPKDYTDLGDPHSGAVLLRVTQAQKN